MPVEHYENFPVASWLCPKHLRHPITAIYHFARTADDIADEGDAPPTLRLRDLDAFAAQLAQIPDAPQSSKPWARWAEVFGPLSHEFHAHRLPIQWLQALLSAFRQDVTQQHYDTREDLLHYCARSANPVGRLLMHLYGVDDPAALHESDAICTALQLTNFWQDLSIDLPRGRIYIPQDDHARHGLARDELLSAPPSPEQARKVAACMRDLVDWAEQSFVAGAALPARVRRKAGRLAALELELVLQGGLRILEKIRRQNFDTLRHRPTIGARDALPLLFNALVRPVARRHTTTPSIPSIPLA
jgi:squalene synthase HpnC